MAQYGDSVVYALNVDSCPLTTGTHMRSRRLGVDSRRACPLWTASSTGNWIDSSPEVANGVVYVGSQGHKLYAFKADGCGQPTCSPLWTATTGNWIYSSPAVANGVVYAGSVDDKLYAFRRR